MFLLQILIQQVSCYFLAKNLKQKKDSVSLLTINLKISFILWIIMSFFHFTLLASLNGQIISWSLAFMCGFTLILCFLMRKRPHDFIVLIVLSIVSIFGLTVQILEEDDVRYFYIASFIMGSFALCFVEKSSLLLVLIIILGFFSCVKMPEIFSFFGSPQEKNVNIIHGLSSAKWYSVLLEAISLIICQLFANNILKKHKDVKQRLNTANDTIKDLIAKLNSNKDRVDALNTQLAQASKSQDLFVSCISHELRNPLNGMMGSIDLLEAEIKDEVLAKILRRCKACGETLSTQINNLLDIAKINSNKLEINEFPTKMSSFIANIWPPIQNKIEVKGLKGCLMIDKNLPLWLDIDSQRFQQILENLLGNALKFTSQGSIRVILSWVRGEKKLMYYNLQSINDSTDLKLDQLSTKESIFSSEDGLLDFDEGTKETSFPHLHLSRTSMSQLEDFIYLKPYQAIECTLEEKLLNHIATEDGFLKVDVLDTGCGITTEAQQKVFEPFVQADASITRNYGGAGLGLFLVKKLVEKMNGYIKMNSLTGLGSSFQITIPIKKPIRTERSRFLSGCQRLSSEGTDREEILGRVLERPWSEAGLKKLPSYRGLIVDDDLLNQNVIRSFLNKLGFEADTANNGLEGLDKYRRNPERYLFVTMDIQMPVMDGMTSRDQIREFENANGKKNVPILFVTGNSSEDYKRECLKNESENSVYFFRKPFRFSDCKTCIEKIMSDIGSSL